MTDYRIRTTGRKGLLRTTFRNGKWKLLQSVNVEDTVEVVDFVLEDDCSKADDRFSDGFYCPAAI